MTIGNTLFFLRNWKIGRYNRTREMRWIRIFTLSTNWRPSCEVLVLLHAIFSLKIFIFLFLFFSFGGFLVSEFLKIKFLPISLYYNKINNKLTIDQKNLYLKSITLNFTYFKPPKVKNITYLNANFQGIKYPRNCGKSKNERIRKKTRNRSS